MTNNMTMNDVPQTFEKLAKFNEQLMGAPVGVLLFLAVIAIGYVLRVWHKCPNNLIPVLQVVMGMVLWMFVCPEMMKSDSVRVWWGRNLLIGIIIPCSAWLVQRTIIKRIEKKFGLFQNGDSLESQTEFIKKETVVTSVTTTPSTKP